MKKYIITALLTTALLLPIPVQTSEAANSTVNQTANVDYSAVFDADYYYQTYPDLQKNIGNDPAALLNHFITTGMKEGRNGNASFQVKAYMYNNPDLMAVYGIDDLTDYYLHYINCGKAEGRKTLFQSGTEFPEGTLARYSTTYDVTEDRAVNVELAASRINGMVLQPGDTFSYSDSVGTRTLENGYVVAPSFAGGKVVSSVGGGICQVSSTLYAAMLLSGIPATQHYLHSLPVDYIPRGLDAAIVEGYKDLKFKNNFDYPIVINAVTKNGTLTVSIVKA
ncbi:MAG: VanW family protein [Suilimivivens sp.]